MIISKQNKRLLFTLFSVAIVFFVFNNPAYAADFGSAIENVQRKVTGVLLPAVAVIGLVFAAISLLSGNPNAKQHVLYAVFGCIFGFGASGIVAFIRDTVR